ncbi:MAG TPA: heme exporter protein CcmB [Acidimicrobiales bacterium]|nr:heme exporter protein CcmB [Acidimicrobiales bacterium]
MWRDALLVAGKDLRIELRAKVALGQVAPFAVVVLLLFGLALGPAVGSGSVLFAAAAGLFWVTVLLATVLAVQRSFALESVDGASDGLRMSGLDPAGIFVGKAAAIASQLLLLEVLLAAVASVLFDRHLAGWAILAASAVAATVGLVALGTIYGVVSIGSRQRETLLPLLFFPMAAPVLLAATKAWDAALADAPGHALGWLDVLLVFAVAYVAIGTVAFGPLLEDA